MQSKKEMLLEALLEGSALVLVNQDDMLTALTIHNLFGLVSIEDNNITILMSSVKIDENGEEFSTDQEIAWTFNTDDIYLMKTFDDDLHDSKETTFWMDKYPHKDLLKSESKSFRNLIENKVLVFSELQNLIPPNKVDDLVQLAEMLIDPANEDEIFECDTEEDSDYFLLLENYILNQKGHLTLKDIYVPFAWT